MITPASMNDAYLHALAWVEAAAAQDLDAMAAVYAAQGSQDASALLTSLLALLAGVLEEHGVDVREWAAERRKYWKPPPQVPGGDLN